MKIAGWHKCSFVDYPGKIAVTVFTAGCNMRCYFCHNRAFLVERCDVETIPAEEVLDFLRMRRPLIDAVVLTGGEPLIQPGLESFLRKVRKLRLAAKIDTNGSDPDKLKHLVGLGLVDYVALDLKAPVDKLNQVSGCSSYPLAEVERSKALLFNSYLEYELRITVLPEFTEEDVLSVGRSAAGARRMVLQQFKLPEVVAGNPDPKLYLPPHGPEFFLALERKMRGWFDELILRNVDLRQDPREEPGVFTPQVLAQAAG